MENGQEKSPISVSSLAADDTLDRAQNSEVLDFPHRIERYGRARKRAVEMGDYLSNFQLPLSPVTPKDDAVASFYKRLGFQSFPKEALTLFLSVASLVTAI